MVDSVFLTGEAARRHRLAKPLFSILVQRCVHEAKSMNLCEQLAVEATQRANRTGKPVSALEMQEILHAQDDQDRAESLATWVMGLAPWQAFSTLTYEWESSLQATIKSYERFMRKELPNVNHFYAIEQNPSRRGHHVHGLWCQSGDVNRKDAWQKWFDHYGRARIEPLHHRNQVVAYCAKYLMKQEAWFNVHLVDPNLRRCAVAGIPGQFEQPILAPRSLG